jgi:hypothetical protein
VDLNYVVKQIAFISWGVMILDMAVVGGADISGITESHLVCKNL